MNKLNEILDTIRIKTKSFDKNTLKTVSHELLLSNVTRVNKRFKNNSQYYRNVHAEIIKNWRDSAQKTNRTKIDTSNFIGIVCENHSPITDDKIVKIKNPLGVIQLEPWKQVNCTVRTENVNDFYKINRIEHQDFDKYNSYVEYQLVSLQTGRYYHAFADMLEVVPEDDKDLKIIRKMDLLEELKQEENSLERQMEFVNESVERITEFKKQLKNL